MNRRIKRLNLAINTGCQYESQATVLTKRPDSGYAVAISIAAAYLLFVQLT